MPARTSRSDSLPIASPLDVEVRERYNPIVLAMRRLPKPIVAAVNGVAAGAGASLAFAADLRIAAENATFVLAFGRIGLAPDSGASWFLPRLVGAAHAAELLYLSDPMPAEEALRIGLVSQVVPAEALHGPRPDARGEDRPGLADARSP